MSLETNLQELKTRLLEVNDLQAASSVLSWDQSTYMPPGGGAARGRQMATLRRLAHEKFTDAEVGRILDRLEPLTSDLSYDSDEAALVRVTRRDYERATKVPSAFMAKLSAHSADTYRTWAEARPQNDFGKVAEGLERTLEYSRELANFFPGYAHIADPLIDTYDYGMRASEVRRIFADLREKLVPLVERITAQEAADDSPLKAHYPEGKQLEFGLSVIKDYGYDLSRGRQDKTHHPFATKFSIGDVRITTRVKESDLSEALFSTLHESGHAMYEQGVAASFEGTPLARGTSAGVHESQSRLWENLVGRSRGFWEHYYPKLQAVFPENLGKVPLESFYRAINKVSRSLIRTDADELTYNLHVITRFDLELDLLEGNLAVRDLPEMWRARYLKNIGVASDDDKDGVLQDVHWFAGGIGGVFQGYTLGNIMSAQFYEAAERALPDLSGDIRRGEFGALHGWLKENIYQHGRKYTATEILERATGQGLTVEPYFRYLETKYGELYDLD